jgi:hypothetical protein
MFSIFRSGEATLPLKQAWEQGGEHFRKAVLKATHEIDRALARDPHQQGESREGETRILLSSPVGVLFQIDDENRRVHVLRAWAYGRAVFD